MVAGLIELFTDEFFKQPADLPPGDVADVRDAIRLPDDLIPGEYTVSIAIVDERAEKPVVRLGIKGRGDDGWYPLSKLSVIQ